MKPYYQHAGITIYHGDCRDVLRSLPEPVDAVLTDPPYGIDYQSAWRTDRAQWRPKIANDGLPFVWWLPDAFSVTRDGGSLLCFCRRDVQDAFKQAIEWAGYTLKSQVIWDREGHGMGDLRAAFAPQHDVIWFAVSEGFRFPGKRPRSVVRASRLSGLELEHPNEKPVELMSQLIESVTAPGEVVLDCFMGVGPTLYAAKHLGRRAIGVDVEERFCEIAANRLSQEVLALELV